MSDYGSIANSAGMWVVCSVVVALVFVQAGRMAFIAYRAGQKLGMSRARMVAAFRCGFTTAIVPSIAVLLGLVVLMPSMGLPFAWMRLSAVGSVTYELMAARAAVSEMGLDSVTADPSGMAFVTAVWAMSLGVVPHLIIVALFTPRIGRLKEKIAGGDEGWMRVMTAAAFFGAVGYMAAQPVVKGGASLYAVAGGFGSMVLLGVLVTVGKQKWLREWALAVAILLGIATAWVAVRWLGIGGG